MNGNKLFDELRIIDKNREVIICLQYKGEAYELLTIDEIRGGRENNSIYICVERSPFEEEEDDC